MSISPEYNVSGTAMWLQNLRSFPQGKRNCYKIGVEINQTYLIRATFMHGDYDGSDGRIPIFDLHIGPNKWDTVQLGDPSAVVSKELIHVMINMDFVHVCLVDTGFGTPFISSLELILMGALYSTQLSSLALFARFNVGSATNETVRFRDDLFDRLWLWYGPDQWDAISTSEVIDNQNDLGLRPPVTVMRSAAIPANDSEPLEFSINAEDTNLWFHVYMYFAEVEELQGNNTRQFDFYLNGNLWVGLGPMSPEYLSTSVKYNFEDKPLKGEGSYRISLHKAGNSTLPPSINAIEVYSIVDLHQKQTNQTEAVAITNLKSVYRIDRNWQGDPCAPQAYLWDGIDCHNNGYDLLRIKSLNLSSSGLIGEITPAIYNMTLLQNLDLSNNYLTGPVPDFLTQLQSLEFLNLAHNNLTGSVPQPLIEKSKQNLLYLRLEGNPYLCASASCKKTNKNVWNLPLLVSFASVLLVVTATLILFRVATLLSKLKRDKHVAAEQNGKHSKTGTLLASRKGCFTHSQLVSITNNFERIIGKGGFGTVYHGYLHGDQVAVKILTSLFAQGYKHFQSEVDVLLRVYHGNLLSLVGYCCEGNQLGLIYEYMAYGNLQEHMSDSSKIILNWEERLRVSLGAAKGLEYLHHGCTPPIVHRDVKTSNILVNENLEAKLADFGLSRSVPFNVSSGVYTDIVGTVGYFDPEYFISHKFGLKSDVYGFGVVLLEIITGRPAIAVAEEVTHLNEWASSMIASSETVNIIDPKLGGEWDRDSVIKAIELAMACTSQGSSGRPSMHHAVNELTECLTMELSRRNGEPRVESSDSKE